MELIDSHAHIVPPWFKKDEKIKQIKQKAQEQGVKYIVNCAINPTQYDFAINLAKKQQSFPVKLGIAPQGIERMNVEDAFRGIERYIEEIVAVGEIGLDYHWIKDAEGRKKQENIFIRAIQLANDHNKPIVIHSRKAEQECINILKKHAKVDVILHCFAGTTSQGMECLDHGWIISIPTAVTNRRKHRELARKIPLESLIIETDSPFLAPTPYVPAKAKNEPALVIYAAKSIGELKNTPIEDIAATTFRTTKRIFKL
ncbi:MAG: TatD family hydrolase [Candidatus Hermodarchaeota archaeon]